MTRILLNCGNCGGEIAARQTVGDLSVSGYCVECGFVTVEPSLGASEIAAPLLPERRDLRDDPATVVAAFSEDGR